VTSRLLLPLVVVAATSGFTTAAEPPPLRGVPLPHRTGLRSLVADDPPFLLDVDTGRVTTIAGLQVRDRPVLSVLRVGKDTVVWLQRLPARGIPRAEIYVVHRGTTKAVRIATAAAVAPSADGHAVWLKSFEDARHCTLREVALDGRTRRGGRPVPCSTRLVDAGAEGLLVQGSSVVDPRTDRTLARSGSVLAMAGDFLLTAGGSHGRLALTDLSRGTRWRLSSPSRIGGPGSQGGIDQAAVSAGRSRIAVSFSDPAWQGSGTQMTDVWLLNPMTRRFAHVPGTPAAVALKFTSMAWTGDGRLVLLAETADHDVVAVWRPGEKRLALRRVELPTRAGGSDSFVAWSVS
jgi:hypothetical protein